MMTTAEAKTYLTPEHYAKYRELGGFLSQNKYRYVAAMFIRYTFEIFVVGNPEPYRTRQEAVNAFQKWANEYGSHEGWHRIFRSIDSVTPYT